MKFDMSVWLKNDKFIISLQNHQASFVQMKQDKVCDFKNKKNIQKLNLNKLMNQLITHAINFKDQQSKINKSKTDKSEDKTNDDNKNDSKFKDKSEEKSEDKFDKNKRSNDRQNSDSTDTLKDLKKNNKNNYNYCNLFFHKEDKCKLKNSTKQSEE